MPRGHATTRLRGHGAGERRADGGNVNCSTGQAPLAPGQNERARRPSSDTPGLRPRGSRAKRRRRRPPAGRERAQCASLLLAICETRGGPAGASCFQPRGVRTTPAHRVAIRAAEQRRRALTARARNRRRAVVRGGPPGRCRLSAEAAAGLRTASRLVAAEQRGVAGRLALPTIRSCGLAM